MKPGVSNMPLLASNSGQKASDGSHEVLRAVGVDPVASVRHSLHLGPREESSNLRVVAGTVRQREGHQEGMKVGRWGEKERSGGRAKRDGELCELTCPMVFLSSQESPAQTQALPEVGTPG